MDVKTHWERIYTTKAPDQVSWYRPHLETSLALVKRAAGDRTASIIDIGAGESTLVDDLLEQGFQNITVLDVSQAAIDVNKTRLGERAKPVHWIVADITHAELEQRVYDVWHDRARTTHCVCSPGHALGKARRVCHREYIWPRGPDQV